MRLFKEISYDTLEDGTPYPVAFEGKKYPIFNVLYHPEYLMVMEQKNKDEAIAVARGFSKLLFEEGLNNMRQKYLKYGEGNLSDEEKAGRERNPISNVELSHTFGQYPITQETITSAWGKVLRGK